MIYTGIGSRETPSDILDRMASVGSFMARKGYLLRSGGANGADIAFEQGCNRYLGAKEIYLPYRRFNQNNSPLYGTTKEARLLAKQFHPNWDGLGDTGRDFMGRNVYQVLGLDLKTPTEFIVCWTPNGEIVGGTGQALRMADHYRIPVFNFGAMTVDEIGLAIEDIIS